MKRKKEQMNDNDRTVQCLKRRLTARNRILIFFSRIIRLSDSDHHRQYLSIDFERLQTKKKTKRLWLSIRVPGIERPQREEKRRGEKRRGEERRVFLTL